MQKLDFFGDEYVTEYVEIEFEKLRKDNIYRGYMAKALEVVANNTGGNERCTLTSSYMDFLEPKQEEKSEEQPETVEEIRKKQHEVFQRLKRRWTT